MKTFTVEVTQQDREAAAEIMYPMTHESIPAAREWKAIRDGEADTHPWVQTFARHRIASQPDDLTAASQLEHSGLITREKYNHIVENIRARDSIRSAMA